MLGLGIACVLALTAATAAPQNAQIPSVRAEGELGARIELVQQRFLEGTEPAFTDDFILADVALRPDYPRRFAEFSGDISGRYLGALALMPPEGSDLTLAGLAHRILSYQREDGRFGAAELSFSEKDIDRPHMALLWGNGRLLVGLMEYYSVSQDKAVLDGARRLGDFLLQVRQNCSSEEVVKRLEGQAAFGFICFTQLIEGLAALYEATQDTRYLAGAEEMAEWFQATRGKQHSHGYLSTLRGMMMLYELTGKAEELKRVETHYDRLIKSPDYLVIGGVAELFGGGNERDEGCSEADFLRLSLQLWKATGKVTYLERAERCLLNHFYANQFKSGDFGHHKITPWGFAPLEGVGRAWWCCSMHGLRAFRDVVDAIVVQERDEIQVNLFQDVTWNTPDMTFRMRCEKTGVRLEVKASSAQPKTLAIRNPSWANAADITLNGAPESLSSAQDGYMRVNRAWKAGDILQVVFDYKVVLELRDRTRIALSDLPKEPVAGTLFYGPRILGVDSVCDPDFHGEPHVGNVVHLPKQLEADHDVSHASLLTVPGAHFTVSYIHEGFPEPCHVTLLPFSEQTQHRQGIFTVTHYYQARP